MNNNNDIFSNFIIDNVRIYIEKYHLNSKVYKLNDFIKYIKKNNKNMLIVDIESIINYMNDMKMPYNYYLFKDIKLKKFSKK